MVLDLMITGALGYWKTVNGKVQNITLITQQVKRVGLTVKKCHLLKDKNGIATSSNPDPGLLCLCGSIYLSYENNGSAKIFCALDNSRFSTELLVCVGGKFDLMGLRPSINLTSTLMTINILKDLNCIKF